MKNELISKNPILLFLVNEFNYMKSIIKILKVFTHKNMPGVYIDLNKPSKTLETLFKNNNVNTDLIFFIDAVTFMHGGHSESKDKVAYIDNPHDLSAISIAVSEAVKALDHRNKFLVLSSINTLLIYNEVDVVIRFLHSLIGKMRELGVTCAFFAFDHNTDKEVLVELSQFSDKIIKGGLSKW